MSDLLLIVKREFRERVKARSFLIGTIVFPIFLIGVILLPRVVGNRGAERTLALLNEAQPSVADAFAATLAREPESEQDNVYHLHPVEGPLARVRDSLTALVEARVLDGYVLLPADILEGGTLIYRARSVAGLSVLRDMRRAATTAVQGERLRLAGLAPGTVAALIQPVGVDEARITATGEAGGGALSSFLVAYFIAFLIYIMVTLYGVAVMRSVLEEKTSRIAEVLMSTMRASHLMAGKILGVGSAAILQVLIWIAIVAAVATQSRFLTEQLGMSEGVMRALQVEPLTGAMLLLFFVLGFFLYAGVFAALGAAVTSEQEAQSIQMLALIPLVVPLLFLDAITNDPTGSTATTLGLIPFTAAIATPMRMAAAPIPLEQILASLVSLLIGLVVVAWIAGRIYRIGILSTGKRPTIAELARWVRQA